MNAMKKKNQEKERKEREREREREGRTHFDRINVNRKHSRPVVREQSGQRPSNDFRPVFLTIPNVSHFYISQLTKKGKKKGAPVDNGNGLSISLITVR